MERSGQTTYYFELLAKGTESALPFIQFISQKKVLLGFSYTLMTLQTRSINYILIYSLMVPNMYMQDNVSALEM